MNKLKESIKSGFPETISFPTELGLLCDWHEENGYPISGSFELRADDGKAIYYWFRSHAADHYLAQFGAGADGSLYCIWKQKDGREPIVHLGSEGDALMVLAANMRDFIRLLALGYDEIGFEDMSVAPSDAECINPNFQAWVTETLGLVIPDRGSEITNAASKEHDDFEAFVSAIHSEN